MFYALPPERLSVNFLPTKALCLEAQLVWKGTKTRRRLCFGSALKSTKNTWTPGAVLANLGEVPGALYDIIKSRFRGKYVVGKKHLVQFREREAV